MIGLAEYADRPAKRPALAAWSQRSHIKARSPQGFTLVELIAVIVILAITSVLGASFITSVIEQYQKAQIRSELVLKGSVALEQLTRQLRMSVPNSLRVSASGACVEFFPLLGGAFYHAQVPDSANGMAPASAVSTMSFSLGAAVPKHVLVSPLSTSEIYRVSSPAARVTAGNFGVEPYTQAVFSAAHSFIRNSLNHRLLIAADPKRFCVGGDKLVRYQDYGLSVATLTDGSPGGQEVLMSTGVAAGSPAFELSLGSEDRNSALEVALVFSDRGEQITLTGRVLVRNVP
ncbi:PulJ/GspJ family protein [Marinagarivorans algicola]|uniref:PulJ/GspJ family protein n=1 Tax=Marinagarivorans algicola TaxID=1513270 RepID=UPI003737099C